MNLDKLLKLLVSAAMAALVAAATSSRAGENAKKPANAPRSPRTVEMKVTENGYEPSPLSVKKGEPLRLRITRTTEATCAKEIIIPDYGIEKELPLNTPVDVELTPTRSGKVRYGCGMGMMIAGVLIIE